MTEEQEQMLQAVLRNQEVIMNALTELLIANPDELLRTRRLGDTITDLGICVGFTHYVLADLECYGSSESQSQRALLR
jgi:hypothetical protein